jgi:hypothetical protein
MDELALLRDYRLEDAAPDAAREHARAALQAAMTRRRLPRRRYAIAIAFAVAAVLAAAAYAIVHQFVIGSPAPKSVQRDIGMHVAVANGDPIPFHTPYKLAGPPLIAAAAHTPAGMVYLLVGRIASGGQCQFLWFADQRTPTGGPITEGGCQFGNAHRKFGYGLEGAVSRSGNPYTLMQGYAPGAVRVRIGDRFFKTPFGWFIAEYDPHDAQLVAYGVHGGVVARVNLRSGGHPPTSTIPVKPSLPLSPVGRRHIFVSTEVGWVQADIRITPAGRSFTWLNTHHPLKVSATRSSRGGVCTYVVVDLRTSGEPRCFGPKANEIQAIPVTVGWVMKRHAPTWVQAEGITGAAGTNIARVDVRFSDGRTATAQFYRGAIFYLIPRANYAAGHRPIELLGRDANGRIVARKRLPYIG